MATCGCDGACGCETKSHFNAQKLNLQSAPSELTVRIVALEAAVIALGRAEFGGDGSGENDGHPFRGNQWSGGKEGSGKNEDNEKKTRGFVGKLGKMLGAKPGTILYKEPTTAKGFEAEKAKGRMETAKYIMSDTQNVFPRGVTATKGPNQRAVEKADYEKKKADYEKLKSES